MVSVSPSDPPSSTGRNSPDIELPSGQSKTRLWMWLLALTAICATTAFLVLLGMPAGIAVATVPTIVSLASKVVLDHRPHRRVPGPATQSERTLPAATDDAH